MGRRGRWRRRRRRFYLPHRFVDVVFFRRRVGTIIGQALRQYLVPVRRRVRKSICSDGTISGCGTALTDGIHHWKRMSGSGSITELGFADFRGNDPYFAYFTASHLELLGAPHIGVVILFLGLVFIWFGCLLLTGFWCWFADSFLGTGFGFCWRVFY